MKTIITLLLLIQINPQILAQEYYTTTVEIINEKSNPIKELIEKNISTLLNTFNKSFFENHKVLNIPSNIITKEGLEILNSIWKNRKYRINETELYVYLLNRNKNSNYEIRDIPLIQLDDEGASVYQSGVFSFSKDGKIDNLIFGVSEHQYKDIISNGLTAIEESRRLIILNFIENFRTSYDRKDIRFIEQVFSEKALIIVGKVIKEQSAGIQLKGNVEDEKVELVKYTKEEYIKNLNVTFKNNRFIKVKYDSIVITQSRVDNNFYAVNSIQEWKATKIDGKKNYEDKGFLFLLIDFTIEDKPTIHVRAWEPYNQTKKGTEIMLGDFDIN